MSITDLTGFDGHGAPEGSPPVPAALELDPARYAGDLAEFDLTEEQKAELLATLWSIMRRFVEIGFSVKICGQVLGIEDQSAAMPGGAVESATASDEADDGRQGGAP